MKFEGEHLLPGQFGHFFVVLAFVASLISTIGFFIAARKTDPNEKKSWLRFSRTAFFTQVASVLIVFGIIFYICSNHYFEYMYVYKHASKELEPKYLLACIWEGQEGSFLLWAIWHSILGSIIIAKGKAPKAFAGEAHIMTVISFAQFFLYIMILGIYFFDAKIGNSPFSLTRNEIAGPIFSQPNYLNFIKDGVGLNVLLRNYWMVIHPPVLFLGFASTIIPFSFAYAGMQMKKFGDWVKPALPWVLFTCCVLGVGIMMGGKWAYESLSFGGYWAWDPVENASLVPWLIIIAGLHTMVVYKATGHSLRASYLFVILTFVFILYSTFLTRTGILGDTSVHAFTEESVVIKIMLELFMAAFALPALIMFFRNYNKIPSTNKEERTDSREFWMFIGSIVFFLSALFISAKTSVPVFNKIFGTKWAPPEDPEFAYNKVMVMVAIIIGILTAITQYFKYKNTPTKYVLKKIIVPTIIAAAITALLVIIYPLTYHKQGPGFLGAVYVALFATIYGVIANAAYIWIGLKGKLRSAGGSISHIGFTVLIVGMLISSSNKEVISSSMANGINLPLGKDPMTKKQDDPRENLTLLRQVPTRMGKYEVTYLNDSATTEKGKRFYNLLFERKNADGKVAEHFVLKPDVYLMKDNNLSSNPSTKHYFGKDVFTYVSALPDQSKEDTAQFKIKEIKEGDTMFYSNGMMVLNKVVKNPNNEKYHFKDSDAALMADITFTSKDGMHYNASPAIYVDELKTVAPIDDTVYAQNLFVRFAGVTEDRKVKIGIKESDKMIDFITLKAYVFPHINIVWLGLIIMAFGIILSLAKRADLSTLQTALALILAGGGVFYMFLLAN